MTRLAMVAVLLGCGTPAVHHDAGIDAPEATGDGKRYEDAALYDGKPVVYFDACIDHAQGCGPLMIIVDGVCEAECAATTYPRCPSGFVEHHVTTLCGADQCTCAPM